MGLERLLLVLEKQGVTLAEPTGVDLFLIPMGDAASDKALQLVAALRREGLSSQMDVMGRSMRKQMKYADKLGARFTAVIGDTELAEGKVAVKNMASGEKIDLPLDDSFTARFSDIEIADRLAKETV